jgi:alpha-L-rhamnosidase
MKQIIFVLLAFFWGLCGAHAADNLKSSGKVVPTQLCCDYAENPLGVDSSPPRLFWKLESNERGQLQTAYEILVASSAEILAQDKGDLWDSGRVKSGEAIQIPYAGRILRSSQQVFWKVRVWDKSRNVSDWNQPASWTMGLLSESDWQAKWIASPTNCETLLLRREFAVKPGLRRALIHVCGLGQYELTLNGAKVGEDLLAPGWTKYDKTCLYDTRDITSQLHAGQNVAGLFLGNGMYNVHAGRYTKFTGTFGPLKAIAQLRLEYADGSVEIIGTDEQWRVASGPITFSSVYGGEDFDARLNPVGWDKSGFDSSNWMPAQVVAGPGGKLAGFSCAAPPLRAFEILQPVQINSIRTNIVVYDLGQNAPIMARIKIKGPAGSRVRIIPAELLKPDGSVDRGSVGNGLAYWQYTLSGDGDENYFSKFFYHGCRYLQIECAAATNNVELPTIESIEGVVVHSASEPVGEFSCSNDLFNRIHTVILWAQRANIVSILTDCPHRERLGWLEQYHLNGPSLRYEFDLAQLYTKGMNDMADSQLADGLVPSIAPEYPVFSGGFRDSPEWGSAFVIVPWQQYQFTGDTELLRRNYDEMKKYVAYLGTKARANIVAYGLGDWYDIGSRAPGPAQLTPNSLTATAFYFYDTWILAQTAAMLGKKDEAKKFTAQADAIRAAFNGKFFNATNGGYATGSQCANAIPLVMNLCEPTNRAAVLDALVADVRQHGNANTAGDVGYRYLLRALAEGGRSDVIFDMNNQSEKPGYGYQLKMGATSLTEAWNANRSSSQNHFMLGQIMEWFYADLAGIAPDPSAPGFKKILIRPQPVGDVTWVKCAYDSIHGRIASEWEKTDGKFSINLEIPPGATATVFIPAQAAGDVSESGVTVTKSRGVKFIRQENDRAIFEIASGKYQFTVSSQRP